MADTAKERRAAHDIDRVRAACTRFLAGHGERTAADMLAMIPAATVPDRYGQGGVVADLEQEVARVLGKEAALFFPSGTMAQQIALRVHADRRGRRGIVFHPWSHLDWHEGRGYERLHGLHGIPCGPLGEVLSLRALHTVHEPPAALLLELPQRDLGGDLPSWDELVAETEWARSRGAAAHMDGARLWEAAPYYDKSPAEVAALFDTVYVSFYKGLGGITGCCLAGPKDILLEVDEWRVRHGGRLYGLWPYAASALTALRERLPKMPRYLEKARSIAAALTDIPGLQVIPDPPKTPMMHVQMDGTPADLLARGLEIARRERVWTFVRPFAVDSPHRLRVEFSVGDATLGFQPDEVRELFRELSGAI
ncbi:MAG: beta-eliminating lyase-related protein [Firmicutes bacterium]|nr:beta-eliminating lyase-related protein [Bacillota bacterium]